jgi:class 3 adenylate cyclase
LAVLGCKPATVTVFFADIVDFTATVERLSPDAIVEILGLFLEAVTNCILAKQGVVDKFIGDAIMAYWNQGKAPCVTFSVHCSACRGCPRPRSESL